MKKKTRRVGKLVVEYIRKRTINASDFFNIFDPYIDFTTGSFTTKITDNNENPDLKEYTTFVGHLLFKMNRKEIKKYNIRSFNDFQGRQSKLWSVWLYGIYENDSHKKTNMYFSKNSVELVLDDLMKPYYDNLKIYHFLREMKKIVPGCLIEIEKLLFERL